MTRNATTTRLELADFIQQLRNKHDEQQCLMEVVGGRIHPLGAVGDRLHAHHYEQTKLGERFQKQIGCGTYLPSNKTFSGI